jgi:PLP dependent protein
MTYATLISRYEALCAELRAESTRAPLSAPNVALLAVVKGQENGKIIALLEAGHRHFAENKVQEAMRWQELRPLAPDIILHHIGELQTNKARTAVALYDVIETLDREKLATTINKEAASIGKVQECYIQVNIGEEAQKSGVLPRDLQELLTFCTTLPHINVTGLMCIPPEGAPPAPYFALMHQLGKHHQLPHLSMGMSADYLCALRFGATHVRLGTKLMGERGS